MSRHLSPRTETPTSRPTSFGGRWAWLLVLVAGVLLFAVDREVFTATHNPNLVPGLLLVGASILPTAFVAFVFGRLRVDVPAVALLGVAAVTGALSVAASGLIEYVTLQATDHLSALAVAVTEEGTKLLIPAALLAVRAWRRPLDGLIIGIAAGGGFGVMETLGYSAVTLINSHESVVSVENVLVIRSIFSPMTHMAWTGLAAAGLWWVARHRARPTAIAWAVGAFAFVVALHATWDSVRTIGSDIALAVVSLAALGITIRLLHSAERRGADESCAVD